jgi:hypothetical protein
VVLGGGQDASNVTTTDHRAGKFEAKFYDKVKSYFSFKFSNNITVCGCLVSSVYDVLSFSYA